MSSRILVTLFQNRFLGRYQITSPLCFANTWNTDATSPAPALPGSLVLSRSINKGTKGITLSPIPKAGHPTWVENSKLVYAVLYGCFAKIRH